MAVDVPLGFLDGIDHVGHGLDILSLVRWDLLYAL